MLAHMMLYTLQPPPSKHAMYLPKTITKPAAATCNEYFAPHRKYNYKRKHDEVSDGTCSSIEQYKNVHITHIIFVQPLLPRRRGLCTPRVHLHQSTPLTKHSMDVVVSRENDGGVDHQFIWSFVDANVLHRRQLIIVQNRTTLTDVRRRR